MWTAVATVVALLAPGCQLWPFAGGVSTVGRSFSSGMQQQREAIREGQLVLTDEQLALLYRVLRRLELREGERFADFLPRARALLVTDDDPALQALAFEIPDDVGSKLKETVAQAMPVLVARWAQGFRKKERQHTLGQLLNERTVVVEGRAPWEARPFRRAIDDVQAEGKLMGLTYDDFQHEVLVFELEPTRPQEDEDQPRLWPPPVGLLTHLDAPRVDPAGWTGEPYKALRDPGGFTGADVAHGKGPLVATLWALGALKASGLWLSRGGRVVVDTQAHVADPSPTLAHYAQERGLPDERVWMAGTLPPVYGRVGQARLQVRAPAPALEHAAPAGAQLQLVALEVGRENEGPLADCAKTPSGDVSPDARCSETALRRSPTGVPDKAWARLMLTPQADRAAVLEQLEGLVEASGATGLSVTAKVDGDARTFLLEADGVWAPLTAPHAGRSAAAVLLRALERLPLVPTPCCALLEVLHEKLGRGFAADGLGLADRDAVMGVSSAVLTEARQAAGEGCTAEVALRWPPPRPAEEVIEVVKATLVSSLAHREGAPAGLEAVAIEVEASGTDPFMADADAPAVSAVDAAYRALVEAPVAPRLTQEATVPPKGAMGLGAVFKARSGTVNERLSDDELERLIALTTFAIARLGM